MRDRVSGAPQQSITENRQANRDAPRTPLSDGGSCFHASACVPARSVGWENRVGSKNYSGVKGITRLRRVLCPATPNAYFNWIPASLNCSPPPPSAEMMNSSGENDGYLLFHHSTARRKRNKNPHAVILAGRREKIAGSDFSRAKRARRARIRDDTRNVAAVTVTRTTIFELGNCITETNR